MTACPDCGETDMNRPTGDGCQHLALGSTNPDGPFCLFWQVFPASGLARFATLEHATMATDALLTQCPGATIIRWA